MTARPQTTPGPGTLRLENEHLTVDVIPGRGAEIRRVCRRGGENVLAAYDWRSPLPASRSTGYADSRLDWLSEYRGGWQELFPNAGAACHVDGVPLPFHGEASTAEWRTLEAEPSHVRLATPARLPLVLEREMRLSAAGPTLLLDETVTNEGSDPASFLWGHHPAFATGGGAQIDLPGGVVEVAADMGDEQHDLLPGGQGDWPHAASRGGSDVRVDRSPPAGVERLCFLPDRQGWAAVRPAGSGDGVGLAWDTETFPHVWLWQQAGAPGFPFYGRAHLTAVEPQSAWPADGLAAHAHRGSALVLRPGEQRRTWMTLTLFGSPHGAVRHVARDGTVTTSPPAAPSPSGQSSIAGTAG